MDFRGGVPTNPGGGGPPEGSSQWYDDFAQHRPLLRCEIYSVNRMSDAQLLGTKQRAEVGDPWGAAAPQTPEPPKVKGGTWGEATP